MKTDYRAQRAFNAAVFGASHPLGYAITPDDYAHITPDNLIAYAREVFVPGRLTYYIAGYCDEQIIKTLDNGMHLAPAGSFTSTVNMPNFEGDTEKSICVTMPQTLQSSIIMGKIMPPYLHPDTPALQFASTMLGGYFGARLMQNLREEHGYTYGIHLTTSMNSKAGCLYVSTDVGKDVTLDAIHQIKHELNLLIETRCEMDEILMVRNVLMGKALRRIDGVFNAQYSLRNLHLNQADPAQFIIDQETYLQIIPYKIQDIAKQYLMPDSLYLVVAGDVSL
jgi:predicted Zn-dependent peptidase